MGSTDDWGSTSETVTVPVTWSPSDTAPRTSTTALPSSTEATEPVKVSVS